MMRKIAALLLVATLAVPQVWGADAKKALILGGPGAPTYTSLEVYNGTIAAGASDSTRLFQVRRYKQMWVSIYVKGSAAAGLSQPYRIAFQARDVACWDSTQAGDFLRGYTANDTTQPLRFRLYAADSLAAPALSGDTLCLNAWVPGGIRRTGVTPADTSVIGTTDTTNVSATRVWPNELLIEMPARRMNQGTTSLLLMQPSTYYFPLADANGTFFRANYVSLRFRNLSTPSIAVRCRLVLYGD
jgi:hypothetical protein